MSPTSTGAQAGPLFMRALGAVDQLSRRDRRAGGFRRLAVVDQADHSFSAASPSATTSIFNRPETLEPPSGRLFRARPTGVRPCLSKPYGRRSGCRTLTGPIHGACRSRAVPQPATRARPACRRASSPSARGQGPDFGVFGGGTLQTPCPAGMMHMTRTHLPRTGSRV